MHSKLTVVIPLFNQDKYIRQCIESVVSQDIGVSVVVVNDGSTDLSLEICEDLAGYHEHVSVISQENRGLAGARLTGIMAASTEYITFVDADDFIIPDAYNSAVDYMDKGIDLISYEITRYFDETRTSREYHSLEEGLYDRSRIIKEVYPKLIWDFKREIPGIECSQCVRIVKRDVLLDAYSRLEGKRFYYGEDWAISIPLMTRIQTMTVISQSYYMHRQSINNTAPSYISSEYYFDEITQLFSYLRRAMSEEKSYDFNKQLDYLYIYSVEMKKWAYNDYEFQRDFIFPFDKVPAGKRIVLYGAGLVGKTYYKQLTKLNYYTEILWVDRNAENMKESNIKSIKELDDMKTRSYDYYVVAIENTIIANEVKDFLITKGVDLGKIVL